MSSIIPFLIFLIAGLGISAAGLRMRLRSNNAKTWPTVPGTVIHIEFDDSSDPVSSDGTSYQTNVTYTYTVSGSHYRASRIAFGYSASRNRQTQFELYTRLKQSSSVTVRYNPTSPSEATLEFVPCRTGVRLIAFGLLWIVFTIVLSVISLTHPAS